MHDLVTDGVPARVVMAGTSTMKLHERFSKLKPRKTIQKAERQVSLVRGRSAGRQVISYNDLNDDIYDELDDVVEEADVQYTRVTPRISRSGRSLHHRGLAGRINVPIGQRLSVPQKTKFIFINPNNRDFRRGSLNRNDQRFYNNNLSKNNRGFRRGGYVSRAGRGRPSNQGGNFRNQKFINQNDKKTVDQLDRELEEYMGSKKHPRITV